MNPSEEDIKRGRQNQQKDVLRELKSHVMAIDNKYLIQVEICLDDFKPKWDKKIVSHSFLQQISRDLTYISVERVYRIYDDIIEDGWGWHYDDWDSSFGRSIYIDNDLVIIYQIHFKEEIINECFPSVEIATILTLFFCFLEKFYEEAKYIGKLKLRIRIKVPEDSVFCIDRNHIKSYNGIQIDPIEKEYNIQEFDSMIFTIIEQILGEFLRDFYNYDNFRIKRKYRKKLKGFCNTIF